MWDNAFACVFMWCGCVFICACIDPQRCLVCHALFTHSYSSVLWPLLPKCQCFRSRICLLKNAALFPSMPPISFPFFFWKCPHVLFSLTSIPNDFFRPHLNNDFLSSYELMLQIRLMYSICLSTVLTLYHGITCSVSRMEEKSHYRINTTPTSAPFTANMNTDYPLKTM